MICKYCYRKFKLSKFATDPSSCLDCSGVSDDLDIDDAELSLELALITNPTGKTKVSTVDFE